MIGTEQTQSRDAASARPLVVARRTDQLGARLCAIVNGLSLAEVLDMEFRFIWPRGLDRHVNDPRQILSQTFLDAIEMQPSELENRASVPWWKFVSLTAPESRSVLAEVGTDAFIDASEPFEIIRSANESPAAATERYRRY